MKDYFRRVRLDIYLSAILTVIIGVVLILWPLEVTGVICRIFGIILAVMGAVYLFGYFANGNGVFSITGGLVFLLLGFWIFLRPVSIARFVPVFLGVILLVHGVKDFQMALEMKAAGGRVWWITIFLSLLNSILGLLCICYSFGVIKFALRVMGFALIYDGISDIWIVYRTVKMLSRARADMEAIDVEAHEL